MDEEDVGVPTDEGLTDIDESSPDVVGGESPAEEAEDAAGPFAEAPNLADLEIED